jgi:small subunit ribosomal protein S1
MPDFASSPVPAESAAEPAEAVSEASVSVEEALPAEEESFGDVLRQFEAEHREEESGAALHGKVISVTAEVVVLDIGRKSEGILARQTPGLPDDIAPGFSAIVNIIGRTEDGYYLLSVIKAERPVDFSGLQAAFDNKQIVAGRVLETVKGGLRVDVGVPAFLPASRSGVREVAELENLVGQEIQVRITKLDVSNPERPDVVVDRRIILEEEASRARAEIFSNLGEGQVVHGRVRSLTDFGAFVEIAPGVDGLLHVSDMSWQRVDKPAAVVQPGQELDVKILKISKENRKISLGLKQLEPDPWTAAVSRLQPGERVQGKVVRLADFGAFIELSPGVDGLIHLSEMSWTKRIHKPADVLQLGEMVEAVVLGVNTKEKRIALGLKQALGNPWDDIDQRYPVNSVVEGPVKSLAQFGAFVELAGGIDGMIHIGDLSRDKRVQHPKEVLTLGQVVKAQVLEVDKDKKRIRLGLKQLEPTSADVFIGEHQLGEEITGRVVDVRSHDARVELAEGVHAKCKLKEEAPAMAGAARPSGDVDDFAALLTQRWKMGVGGQTEAKKNQLRPGQIRRFRITALDAAGKRIDVELAD